MKKNYDLCKKCNTWHWLEDKCSPIFYFKHEDWGDEFQEIRAHSFDDAAKNFAKLYNEDNEYCLMNSNEDVIISDGKIEKKYDVSAERDIHYSVHEVG